MSKKFKPRKHSPYGSLTELQKSSEDVPKAKMSEMDKSHKIMGDIAKSLKKIYSDLIGK